MPAICACRYRGCAEANPSGLVAIFFCSRRAAHASTPAILNGRHRQAGRCHFVDAIFNKHSMFCYIGDFKSRERGDGPQDTIYGWALNRGLGALAEQFGQCRNNLLIEQLPGGRSMGDAHFAPRHGGIAFKTNVRMVGPYQTVGNEH